MRTIALNNLHTAKLEHPLHELDALEGDVFRGFCLLPPPPFRCFKSSEFPRSPFISLRPSFSMDPQDARLERGGGDARCTCSSARRKVAAVLVTQSLTAMCAAFSLCIFLSQTSDQNKGIYLEMTADKELRFNAVWNQSVDLNHGKEVVLSCAGPYIVYLWACVRSYSAAESEHVNLTMQQGSKSVYQQSLYVNETILCHETKSIVMLSDKIEVTIRLEQIKTHIEILHLGLHYLLGAQCFPSPITGQR